jgi:hypothetical protein
MARIRSVHPGLFTDQAFVDCSVWARLLIIGLWTEADDNGIFEWKPRQLKMRVFPGDNVDVEPLLEEMEAADVVCRYQVDGKTYGAVRNFLKFQKPRKPHAWHPVNDEIRIYVGSGAASSDHEDGEAPTVPQKSVLTPLKADPVPQKSECGNQMEDGEGVGEEEESSVPHGTGAAAPLDELSELRALPVERGAWQLAKHLLVTRGEMSATSAGAFVGKLAKDGLKPPDLWAICEAAWKAGTLDPKSYLTKASVAVLARAGGVQIDLPSEARQRAWAQEFRQRGASSWRPERGPKPGEPGCRIRPEILAEFDVRDAA